MDVLIFKTNLTRRRQSVVANALAGLRGLIRWTVDYEDCDRVLRIESEYVSAQVVVERLNRMNILCREL